MARYRGEGPITGSTDHQLRESRSCSAVREGWRHALVGAWRAARLPRRPCPARGPNAPRVSSARAGRDARALLSEALGEKASPVVGHAEREVDGSEPNGHQEVASPGMAERIAHRLLDDTKGAKLDVGGKASLGAGDLELGDGRP